MNPLHWTMRPLVCKAVHFAWWLRAVKAGDAGAEAVELTVVDLRWQMVLERLGEKGPAFAQGTLVDFRNRMVRTDRDRRLLERTVALAKKTGEFDLWHAARKIVEGAFPCA